MKSISGRFKTKQKKVFLHMAYISLWNSLSQEMVMASTLENFKGELSNLIGLSAAISHNYTLPPGSSGACLWTSVAGEEWWDRHTSFSPTCELPKDCRWTPLQVGIRIVEYGMWTYYLIPQNIAYVNMLDQGFFFLEDLFGRLFYAFIFKSYYQRTLNKLSKH